ncbi:MAG: OmcA/MtrC family decaheme c-type cytochrome [Rhodoferax sp.]|nr:OmcA/MtrC family decaheme c-type cytochrome [Rhodoferax sp.]
MLVVSAVSQFYCSSVKLVFLTLMPKEAKVKSSELSSKSRSSPHWIKFAAASLIAAAIAGCGGGGTGANTPVTVSGNATAASATAAAAWKVLQPQITITSAAIPATGNPVIQFTVTDTDGKPVTGLDNYSQATTAWVKALTNVSFTLAKLVPAANGEPSRWVSYNVVRPPTIAERNGTLTNKACDATTNATWCGTFPAADSQGTLVDNGDGSYQYTFYRDPKQAETIVGTLIDNGTALKADLVAVPGDLAYVPTATHRVGIMITGNAPGTGTNNPTAATTGYPTAVAMDVAGNATYDFIPATGAAVTATDTSRDIVNINTCATCHNKKGIGHNTRRDPKLCVTCHTDQTKFSYVEVAKTGTAPGPFTYTATTARDHSYGKVGGESAFTYPRMIHQYHMGKLLKNQGYNLNNHCTLPVAPAILGSNTSACFNTVALPMDVRNCTTCHDGAATGVKAVKDGDNWKNVPSAMACGSCHDGINFADDTGIRANGAATGHGRNNISRNLACSGCHTPADNALYHSDTAAVSNVGTTLPRKPMSTAAARTMSAVISGAAVDASTGNVTVSFKVLDGATEVTDPAAISGLQISLARLNPAVNGASTDWQSYTGKARTTVAANPPVIQGYSETALMSNVTIDATTHVWTYKFQLLNGSTPGDIRTIDHVHNLSSASVTGPYSAASAPSLAKLVAYEPTLTHRIGMEFSKAAVPAVGATPAVAAVANKFNAIYDWVPAGGTAQTRNIVSMNSCNSCHNGLKIHKGYTTEYCVTCHNANTMDPSSGIFDDATGVTFSGKGSKTVDLQVIVHKLHMGNKLPSVAAGTPFQINGAGHDYSNIAYPGVINNCEVCHSPTAKKANGTTALENAANWYTMPTKAACATCHDGASTVAHVDAQTTTAGYQTCVTCHGPNSSLGVDVKTVHSKKIPK